MTVVWGIDVSTTRVAFGSTSGLTISVEIPKISGAVRLARAREETVKGARAFVGWDGAPLCIWLEQPTGRYPKPTLVQMVGVVTEAIYTALSDHFAYPVTVYPVAVASWKKAVLGKGNATKEDVYEWAAGKQSVLIFENNNIQGLANQDEADALAIAFAGRSMIAEDVAA